MIIKQVRIANIALAVIICNLVLHSTANAHFIWVAKSAETGKVNVYFGEGPYADKAQFLGGLSGMQVWSVDVDGKVLPILFEKKTDGEDGWFECSSDLPLIQVDVDCEYGLFSRGENAMFLHYSAKYVSEGSGRNVKSTGKLPLDIAFEAAAGQTTFSVTFNAQPATDCELQIVDGSGATHDLKTDAAGKVVFNQVPQDQWLVRAKMTNSSPGEVDGKAYDEKRYYCTLAIGQTKTKVATDEMAKAKETKLAKTDTAMQKSPFPELPIGVTSFGGAIAGDHLYVFGGHCGDAHDYYKAGQNATLYRLNVKKPNAWETVNESTGLQGLAMVEHKGNLYRVGGFTALNEQGQEQDLHSVAEFARFNFESNQWDQMKPMPNPRSSLDAVVVGDSLFVVGGWMIDGKEKTVWSDNMVSIDLSDPDADWETISVPFKRRALSVAHQGDQLYVVGGMQESGGTTSEVEIYDIKSKSWRDGPTLPGSGEMEGFGSSSFNVGSRLVVSTYGGSVLKLNEAADGWQQIHQLENGRFFHRLLPLTSDKFILVGGANMETGKFHEVQVLDVR